jgi:protein-S-isoprenylcysteine O-methyltransferase Ste14
VNLPMKDVNQLAIIGFTKMLVILPTLIFLPAWTFDYWQGWLCLFAFFTPVTFITLYLMKKNPELLARRTKAGVLAEKQTKQKIVQAIASIGFICVFSISALDHRYHWSSPPVWAEFTGDILIVAGLAFVFWVFRVNSFTSGIIEVAENQRVISSGPYAIVRHPMYFGALVMLIGIPLSLGSLWGLLTIILMTAVLIWRLLDEERYLVKNLDGYAEYLRTVHYRLAPLVW